MISHATTLYGFLIKTIQCWPSEMWLSQIAFSTGIVKWSAPFGVWKCGSPEFEKKWKRYSTPQFFKLVIFSIYPSSRGINWKSNQEHFLRRLAEAKFQKKRKKLANGGMERRTVTLSQPKKSRPLYFPVENAICKSHISDRYYWIVSIGKP